MAGYSPWGRKRVRHDLMTKQQIQPTALILTFLLLIPQRADFSWEHICTYLYSYVIIPHENL